MDTVLPGTVIDIGKKNYGIQNAAKDFLDSIFCTGGLTLGQVCTLTSLEDYTVQNWVKRGFVSPPVKKLYSKRQFCRIAVINLLMESMQIEKIVQLLRSPNGCLADESDDLVDDSMLYNYYVDVLFAREQYQTPEETISYVIRDYQEPQPGARRRLAKVLLVMFYSGEAARYAKISDRLLCELN